jgi:hypothetical protein
MENPYYNPFCNEQNCTDPTIYSGTDGLTAAERALYVQLVSSESQNLAAVESKLGANKSKVEAYINLYNSMRQAYDSSTGQYVTSGSGQYVSDKGFQNLLTVGYISQAYQLPKGSLTVSKSLIGDTANLSDTSFTFEAVFKSNGSAYKDDITATVSSPTSKVIEPETWHPDENGKVTFSLKAGESATMSLPAGVTYTVTETNLPENCIAFSPAGGTQKGVISSGADSTVSFVNSYTGTLTVSKTVTGDTSGITLSGYGFTTTTYLKQGDETYTGPVLWTKDGLSGTATSSAAGLTFTLKAGESVTMTIPAGVTYTVTETNIPEGFTVVNPANGTTTNTIVSGTHAEVGFVNRYGDEEESGALTVSKSVRNETVDMPDTDFTFEAVFTKDNVPYTQTIAYVKEIKSISAPESMTPDENGKVTFTLKKNESIKMVLSAGVTYTVKEINVPDNFTLTSPTDGVTGTIAANVESKEEFVNTYLTEGTLTVSKTVTGDTANMPDTSFSFEAVFTQNSAAYTGAITWKKSDNSSGTWTPDSTTGKVPFTLKNGESVTMTLPVDVAYTVTETNIPTDFSLTGSTGTTGTIEGGKEATAAFTNAFTNSVNISGTKTWANEVNANTRPAKITLNLYKHLEGTADSADALVIRTGFNGSFDVTSSTSWKYSFSGMPKYEGGKLITYYVTEPDVPTGYTFSYTAASGETNPEKSMNITNTYQKQSYDINLSKTVSGSYGDLKKAFAFEIYLKDETGNAVSDSFAVETKATDGADALSIPGSKLTFTDGKAEVALTHGQSITIKSVPEGYKYEIKEVLESDSVYTTSIHITSGSDSDTKNRTTDTGELTLSANATAAFTNTMPDVVPTGIHTNAAQHAMFLIMLILLVGIACIFRAKRRSCRRQ